MSLAIVWFRRDLRLADNPALSAACERHDRILPVYIHAPEEEAPWSPGAASRWWLHHSLGALDAQIARRHGRLHLRTGGSLETLHALVHDTGAAAVYWNRLYEPALVERDARIKHVLRERGLDVHSFNAALLCEPWDIATQQGEPYRVFTPFWRKLRAGLGVQAPEPVPQPLSVAEVEGGGELDEFDLVPRIAWAAGLGDTWAPGEAGAWDGFARFREHAIAGYAGGRDRPDQTGTSRLSPHLHFGEISSRQILWELEADSFSDARTREGGGAEAYRRELGWREFSHHLLYHFPQTPCKNLNSRFDKFPWARKAPAQLERWQQGRTGIPIVDAGMRELWHTGWMHNRVRMIVASFLTKNLRQHWLHGARWFWDTLVDADLANNTQGWQWTAGCGADAAPYFRIFNPVRQAERFDPQGEYIRRWVPELARLDETLLREPWKDEAARLRCGYPEPMVDLRQSRQQALDAYAVVRGG